MSRTCKRCAALRETAVLGAKNSTRLCVFCEIERTECVFHYIKGSPAKRVFHKTPDCCKRCQLKLGALALGYTISALLELILLLWLLRRKMGGLDGRRILDGVWRMGAATLIMALVTWFVMRQFSEAAAFWQLLIAGLAAAVTYLGASYLLRITELEQLVTSLRQRLRI